MTAASIEMTKQDNIQTSYMWNGISFFFFLFKTRTTRVAIMQGKTNCLFDNDLLFVKAKKLQLSKNVI